MAILTYNQLYNMLLRCLFILCVGVAAARLPAQTDSTQSQTSRIAACRQELLYAFWADNRGDVQYWLDSLLQLENDQFTALQWDERWFLHLWLENYSPLLSEVEAFNPETEHQNLWKFSPPQDSLYEWLDNLAYRDRDILFSQIRSAWLNNEEREFTGLLLEYMLRLATEQEAQLQFDERLNQFLKKYPDSRFKRFIHDKMYYYKPGGRWGLGLDLLFLSGTWDGSLERTLKPCFGADLAIGYWRKGWNAYLRFPVGAQQLARPVEEKGYIWEKGESSTFLGIELEGGYDVINTKRLRMLPTVGGGYSLAFAPTGDEDDPKPDYFEYFSFGGAHLSAALQADVKFNLGAGNVAGTYHGVRVRMGYKWLNLGRKNNAFQGNMFFFAVGYTLFGRQASL